MGNFYNHFLMRIVGGMLRIEICGDIYKTFILASVEKETTEGLFEIFRTRHQQYHSKYTFASEREFIQFLVSKGVRVLDENNQELGVFVACKSCEDLKVQEANAELLAKKREIFHEQAEVLYRSFFEQYKLTTE